MDGERERDRHERTKPSVKYAFYIPITRKDNKNIGKNRITNAQVNEEPRLLIGKRTQMNETTKFYRTQKSLDCHMATPKGKARD